MLCATHLSDHLALGKPVFDLTISEFISLPAAVTVYRGEAMCAQCYANVLRINQGDNG